MSITKPETHRVRLQQEARGYTFDRITDDPKIAEGWFERCAESVRSGRVRGHASWSRNKFISHWVQTPESA